MGTLLIEQGRNKIKEKRKTTPGTVLFTTFMFLFGIAMVAPFVFMISASLKPPAEVFVKPLQLFTYPVYWENVKQIFHHPYYFHWYWNSITTVGLTIILRTLFVTTAAYAFARLHFPGKNVLFMILLSTIMIPADTTIVARFLLYKNLHLIDTQWSIILPASFDVFFIFLLRQFFMSIPKELTESGIVDGCSHYRIFYQIILPLAKPAMLTMILFSFIWTWNDYVNPFIFISNIDRQLVTVGLEYFQQEAGQNYALQMAGACFVVIIPVVLFTFTQKYFIQGVAMSGIKG